MLRSGPGNEGGHEKDGHYSQFTQRAHTTAILRHHQSFHHWRSTTVAYMGMGSAVGGSVVGGSEGVIEVSVGLREM